MFSLSLFFPPLHTKQGDHLQPALPLLLVHPSGLSPVGLGPSWEPEGGTGKVAEMVLAASPSLSSAPSPLPQVMARGCALPVGPREPMPWKGKSVFPT